MNLIKTILDLRRKQGAGGGQIPTYAEKLVSVFGNNLISHFPVSEESGNTLNDIVGGYNASSANVTLNQPGYSGKSGLWGATSYADVYAAANHLNVDEGTFMFFLKMQSAQWIDTAKYTIVNLRYNGIIDQITVLKDSQILKFSITRNGTTKYVAAVNPNNSNFLWIACTWSATSDSIDMFINGVKFYDFDATTGIGTHSGAILRSDLAGLGSGRGGSAELSLIGNLCHVSFLNKATNETELTSLIKLDQVIFDGDSRTAYKGWNVTAIGSNFVSPRNVAHIGYSVQNCIDAGATVVDANYRLGKNNICVFFAGVNSSTLTASEIYAQITTYCNARRAAGFKVIVCTEIDAQDATRIANGWPAKYLELNTLIRNDHSFADAVADLGASPYLQDATNLTYFLSDKIHPTVAGGHVYASIIEPVIGSLI